MASFQFPFLAICLIQSVSTVDCLSSTAGKEFYFGILDTIGNCCHEKNNIVALDITNASPNDAHVRMQIPYFNNDTYFNIPTRDKRTILLDPRIQRHGSFVGTRGIRILSDNDISVLVSNAYPGQASIDSYNVLATSNLGNSFILSSHGSDSAGRGGIVMVSGMKNNTNVTLVNGAHVLQSVVVNTFDVLQYSCSTCDLTGVKVISDKDVFVVSGTAFTQIPTSSNQDEYIASEMFPVSTWSRKYIVSPVLPKSAFMLRILSEDTFVNVNATISNLTRSYRLTENMLEQYFETEPVVVTANHRFSLAQYGVGYDYDSKPGDPFMTVVPGVDQYINEYKFSVPHGYYDVKSHVAIIVPTRYQEGLMLDGVSIYYNTGPVKSLNVPAPFDDYTILIFSVSGGYHHFIHSSSYVKFGVFVYGLGNHNGHGLSYGFYAGFDLNGKSKINKIESVQYWYQIITA